MKNEKGTGVKLIKTGKVDDPEYESAVWSEYNEGEYNPKSPPVDYEAKGSLAAPVEEGASVVLLRTERNGKEAEGIMRTSPVQSVTKQEDRLIAETMNSVYVITEDGNTD